MFHVEQTISIMKELSTLMEMVKALPDKPGVYQYFNANEEIIYVGKPRI